MPGTAQQHGCPPRAAVAGAARGFGCRRARDRFVVGASLVELAPKHRLLIVRDATTPHTCAKLLLRTPPMSFLAPTSLCQALFAVGLSLLEHMYVMCVPADD